MTKNSFIEEVTFNLGFSEEPKIVWLTKLTDPLSV